MQKRYIPLLLILMVAGCEIDNYDPPSSELTGRLVFEGEPVEIRQGIEVLQLYQPGFDNVDPIRVNVQQDGSFSSMLFDGSYQLVRIGGNGPWDHIPDTIHVDVQGATEVRVPVIPYFSVSAADFSVENGTLTARCRVQSNVEGRELESVSLMVGKTMLVDHVYRLAPAGPEAGRGSDQIDPEETITLQQDLNTAPFDAEPHLYARIGVKTVGNPEYIYSPVWQIR